MLKPKRQSAQTVTVTAPIGGWNAINSLQAMSPNEAVIIDNWFCLPTELQLRQGYTEWATGITGTATSFLNYEPPSGSSKFFVAANNAGACSIYNVSAGGAVGAAAVTGLTSAQFHYAAMTNTSGHYMFAVNGQDKMRLYDGTTWYTITNTGTYGITGVDTALFSDVRIHKRRAWFVEKDSMSAWYLGTDAVSGSAQEFDFGPIFALGGKIVKIDTWSLDAGEGMDDYFVVITSKGEVAVYTGTNPASATDWLLKGVYYVGSPVGDLCTMKFGGDILLINKDGLIPLSQSLMSSRVNMKQAITNKIQAKISQDTTTYSSNYGWQAVLNPPLNMLILNIPTSSTTSKQYVMNTISGAWSSFSGINATSWIFTNESMYFCLGTKVYKFWDGHNDNGVPIVSDLLPAFTAFGSQVQIKRMTMTRLSMGSDNTFNYNNNIALDFDLGSSPSYPLADGGTTNAGLWDTALWDVGLWGGDIVPFTRWQMAAGMGHYVSMRLKTASQNSDIRYYSIDYVYEAGGVL